MILRSTFRAGRCFSVASLCLLVLGPLALGGDKIQITEGSEKTRSPSRIIQDDLLSRPLDFIKRDDVGNSIAPILPPPRPPLQTGNLLNGSLRKEKFEEKDWLKATTGTLDTDAALKQIFGVREYKLEDVQNSKHADLERLFEKDAEQNGQLAVGSPTPEPFASLDNDPLKDVRGEKNSRSKLSRLEDNTTGLLPELDIHQFLYPERMLDPLAPSLPASLNQNRLPDQKTLRPLTVLPNAQPVRNTLEKRSQELDNWLGPLKNAGNPLASPIQSQADPTRQEINPITARKFSGFEKGFSQQEQPGSKETQEEGSRFIRPSLGALFDSLRPKPAEAPSMVPDQGRTSPQAFSVQPRPAVLELPKRKF